MSPRLSLSVRGQLVRQGLEDLEAEIPLVGRRQIYNLMRRVQAAMKKEGAPVIYPIQWDTPKQRRAYFATDGFGHGIPYRRRGKYVAAWRIKKADKGYQIANQSGPSKHIAGNAYGIKQSRIHRGRWPVLRDEMDKELDKLPGNVRAEIVIVARRKGFEAQ